MTGVARKIRRRLLYVLIALLILTLLILATLSTFVATESGSRFVLNSIARQVGGLEDTELSFARIQGNFLQGLSLSGLRYGGPGVEVTVQRINLSWDPSYLLAGRVVVAELLVDSVAVRLDPTEPEPDSEPETNSLATLDVPPLPVAFEIGSLTVANLELTSGGQTTRLDSLEAELQWVGAQLSARIEELVMAPIRLAGDITVELTNWLPLTGEVDWQYTGDLPADYSPLEGQLELSGSLETLSVEHELLSPVPVRSVGTIVDPAGNAIALDLSNRVERFALPVQGLDMEASGFELTMRGALDALEIAAQSVLLSEQLPDIELSLDALLQGERLAVRALRLASDGGSLRSEAVIGWASGLTAEGHVELQEDAPLRFLTGQPAISIGSTVGRVEFELSQSEEDSRVTVGLTEFSTSIDDYPLTATGRVNLVDDRLQIETLEVLTNSNRLLIEGEYEQAMDLRWQLDAPQLQQFVPGISGRLAGSGFARGNPDLPDLSGELEATALASEQFSLSSLHLSVDGKSADYRVSAEAVDLLVGGVPIEALSASFDGGLAAHTLSIEAMSTVANLVMEVAGGVPDGNPGQWRGSLQRMELGGAAGEWRLSEPGVMSWAQNQMTLERSCWRLNPTELCLTMAPEGEAAQQLRIDLTNFPLDEFNAGDEDSQRIALEQIPRLPETVSLQGMVNARVEAVVGANDAPQVDFNGSVIGPRLILRTAQADDFGAVTTEAEIIEQSYDWQDLSVTGSLQQGDWSLQLDAALAERRIQDQVTALDGTLRLDLSLDAQNRLAGNVVTRFDNLGWVAAFAPELASVTGSLDGDLDLAGTLDNPNLTGNILVRDGAFLVESTGVDYTDLNLDVDVELLETTTFEGGISAGSGSLEFSGQADRLTVPDWQIALNLTGDSLPLVNLPDLNLNVTPDLRIRADTRELLIQGQVDVPHLDYTLRELPPSAVDISRDVVIERFPEDRPELGRSFTAGQTSFMNLPVVVDVDLALGNDVRFRGFGLVARLTGGLEIQQNRNGTNLTYGDLIVREGIYELYGQQLTLQTGEILFLGNYQNPALDVRATRRVEGLTVGVHMNGTVSNLRSELFSSPVIPESDIISVMVTGRPVAELRSGEGQSVIGALTTLGIRQSESISQQIGQSLGLDTLAITSSGNVDSSVLTLGKYLTPDLFIRYGVGLFDNESRVAVDYSINDRVTLQAESGESQSVDLSYKVER